jgi:superfamily II DNA/RNA helicase
MADMGFLPEVRRLLAQTSEDRQTILFSATLDRDVDVLTREYQRDAARHEVGPAEPDLTLMRHEFPVVDPADRLEYTARMAGKHGQTIVFCRTRHIVDRVVRRLNQTDVEAAAIHGGRSQSQRTRALEAFRSGRVEVLVATDVAARGIHVDGIACVVHYDLPADGKTYVHRSGRTGRAGALGVVISLVGPQQVREARRMGREAGLDLETADGGGSPGSSKRSRPSRTRGGKPSQSTKARGRHQRKASTGRRQDPGRSGRHDAGSDPAAQRNKRAS